MECKLCDRKFANGKALGGHMRSHYATLPLPPKTPQRLQELADSTSSSSIFSSDERESSGDKSCLLSGTGSYGLREKPKKSMRLVDPDFCDSVVDRESESGSTRSRCRKGKRVSREEDDQEVTKKGKHVSETPLMSEIEEDVASCLVMLSRDVWGGSGSDELQQKLFKCEECDRAFKSTQGLGSHRANHHQQKKSTDDVISEKEPSNLENHECGFCGKVFRSGKALGGHKRVHLQPSKLGTSLVEEHSLIDLNLPPQIEDEDEELYSC